MLKFLKSLFASSKKSNKFSNIFAAKVIAIEKHPNADRLRLIKVDDGNKIIEPIVCGAFNFEVGDMVALALPGAEIAQNIHSEENEPFILQKAKIRGIESQGMICAEFELGIGPLSEKPEIMVLKQGISPGSQFNKEMIK